jgi:predicted amidohydrolase
MRVAALQVQVKLGVTAENLAVCEQLISEAGRAKAELIVLPEFFNSGMAFSEKLRDAALPPEGPALALLLSAAKRFRAYVGGSFLCRDVDGHVRNAFFLVNEDGVVGRHDKDLPTLWENCWYVGGTDSGLLEVPGGKVGVAICAELGRTATVERLRGSDLIVGGSFTWHAPEYWPHWLGRAYLERRFFSGVSNWAAPFARLVGAPVVEATHCGSLECRDQLLPLNYRCRVGDGAKICSSDGVALASRAPEEGPGVVLAALEIGSTAPIDPLPDRKWIRSLGPLGSLMFAIQRWHGRAYYKKNNGEYNRSTQHTA